MDFTHYRSSQSPYGLPDLRRLSMHTAPLSTPSPQLSLRYASSSNAPPDGLLALEDFPQLPSERPLSGARRPASSEQYSTNDSFQQQAESDRLFTTTQLDGGDFGSLPGNHSPPHMGEICVVCESTNGPWRRGPLGLRCLCNSCGHIQNSSKQATSYEEAIHLLDALRITRIGRVRRRHDVAGSADLLRRLERLSDRTLELTRLKFPRDASINHSQPARSASPLPYAGRGIPSTQVHPIEFGYPFSARMAQSQGDIDVGQPARRSSDGGSTLNSSLSRGRSPTDRGMAAYPALPLSSWPNLDPSFPNRRESTQYLLPPLPPPIPGQISKLRNTSPASYALDSYRRPANSRTSFGTYSTSRPMPFLASGLVRSRSYSLEDQTLNPGLAMQRSPGSTW